MRARTIGFTLALVVGVAWTPGEAGTTAGGGSCPGDQLAQSDIYCKEVYQLGVGFSFANAVLESQKERP